MKGHHYSNRNFRLTDYHWGRDSIIYPDSVHGALMINLCSFKNLLRLLFLVLLFNIFIITFLFFLFLFFCRELRILQDSKNEDSCRDMGTMPLYSTLSRNRIPKTIESKQLPCCSLFKLLIFMIITLFF